MPRPPSAGFDPYHVWLGIPPDEQPPDHYRLLGLKRFEEQADVIQSAADRGMAHVRSFQSGPRAAATQSLLNDLAAARICLLQPQKKAQYDDALRMQDARRRAAAAQAFAAQCQVVDALPTPAAETDDGMAWPVVLDDDARPTAYRPANAANQPFPTAGRRDRPRRRPQERPQSRPTAAAAETLPPVRCPFCGLQVAFDGRLAGLAVNCPQCQRDFLMPMYRQVAGHDEPRPLWDGGLQDQQHVVPVLLSFICPGLGQFLLGDTLKGVILFCSAGCLFILAAATCVLSVPFLAVWLFSILDAYWTVQRRYGRGGDHRRGARGLPAVAAVPVLPQVAPVLPQVVPLLPAATPADRPPQILPSPPPPAALR